MLYLFLGAFAAALLFWIIKDSRLHLQLSKTFRSRVMVPAIAITILIIIAMAVYFLLHEIRSGDLGGALRTKHLAELTLNVLAGLGVGFFISYCIRIRSFKIAHLGILAILIVIGSGPQYWSVWLTSLGITRIGQVEFSQTQSGSKAIYLDGTAGESSSSVSIQQLSALFYSDLLKWIDRDNDINELLGNRDAEDIDYTKRIKTSLGWLTRFAACISAYESDDSNKYATTSVRRIVKPVAQGFYDILNSLPAGYAYSTIKNRESIAKNFVIRLNAAYSNLRELPLVPSTKVLGKNNCPIKKIHHEDFAEQLNVLAKLKSNYPYAIIGLAYLLKVGELDVVEREFSDILDNWINSYLETNPWNARTMTYIVRAYSTYDLLMAVDEQPREHMQEALEIKNQYLGVLQALLKHAARKDVLNNKDPDCKSSEHERIKGIIIAEILARNSFAVLAGKVVGKGDIYRDRDSIKYQRKALVYADKILRYTDPISATICLDSKRTRGFTDYLRATFLDTHASVKVHYARYEYNAKIIGTSGLIGVYKGAISKWNDALTAIDRYEKITNNSANTLRKDITDQISMVASDL